MEWGHSIVTSTLGLLMRIGWYGLVAALVCLWVYGQYWHGRKVYDRDRNSGVKDLFSKDE